MLEWGRATYDDGALLRLPRPTATSAVLGEFMEVSCGCGLHFFESLSPTLIPFNNCVALSPGDATREAIPIAWPSFPRSTVPHSELGISQTAIGGAYWW